MPRTHSLLSQQLLAHIGEGLRMSELFSIFGGQYSRKPIYDCLFRLLQQGLIVYSKNEKDPVIILTEDASELLARLRPVRDGVWKIVIFDIPEKKRSVRNTLRAKLKALGFKKWQGSIWVSPYKLDSKIEKEFAELAAIFFIRLIKTTEINYTNDLENLFR